MRSYELMYILDPKLDEDASGALMGKIEELMNKQGVEVEKTEPWGKRRLAYSIKGNWEGTYILSYLKAEATAISDMERRLRVTDGILRFLTVRMDEQQAKLDRRKARESVQGQARRERRAATVAASKAEGEKTAATARPSEPATAPKATAPKATVPEATVPEATVPEATVPKATVPEATVPEATAPKATDSEKET